MRTETLFGNVVRFPVERRARPTMSLLREIRPDVRKISALAEAFGMEPPAIDLRERVDADTAEYIVNYSAGDGSGLDRLMQPVVHAAVAASRIAHDAALAAADAARAIERAMAAGQPWLDPLWERVESLMQRYAELALQAHARAEEAEGVARAVGLARRGVPWTPLDPHAETDAPIAEEAAARAG